MDDERLRWADSLVRSLSRLQCFKPSLVDGRSVDCRELRSDQPGWSHGVCDRCLAIAYVERWPVSCFTEWLRAERTHEISKR